MSAELILWLKRLKGLAIKGPVVVTELFVDGIHAMADFGELGIDVLYQAVDLVGGGAGW